MTYLVARPKHRFEIRESALTPAGPRSRTLATFRVLSEEVLEHAAGRARRPFDRDRIEARALTLLVPRAGTSATRAARELLGALRRGSAPAPSLVGRLRAELPHSPPHIPDSVEPALEWIGTSDAQRGAALRDLLLLSDRIPKRVRPNLLAFPGIHPTGAE
jgi:hypothetical protein